MVKDVAPRFDIIDCEEPVHRLDLVVGDLSCHNIVSDGHLNTDFLDQLFHEFLAGATISRKLRHLLD